MPFLELSFSTQETAVQFQQSVNQSLRRLYLPIRPLNVLLDLSIRDWSSQKPCRKILYILHLVLVILLFLSLFLCLLIEPYTVFVMDSSQTFVWVVYAAYFLKIQGFVSIIFVLIWNFKRKRQNFQSILVEASSGAGCLRKDKQLRTVNYTFLLYNLLRLLFVIGIAFLRKFYRPPTEFESEQQEENNEQFFVITVFTSVVCGLGQMIAFSIILSFTCIMSSEFRALADDFRSDSNTYQLAVLTHYTFAYKNLLRLYSCLKVFLEFWINAQLCFAYFQVFYILSTADLFDGSVELSLNFILLVDALITIATSCYLTIRVDSALKGLCVSMLSLSISGKVLNEGTYAQLNTFAEYMQVKKRKILFVVGMFKINVKTVVRFTLLIASVAVWNRFNSTSNS